MKYLVIAMLLLSGCGVRLKTDEDRRRDSQDSPVSIGNNNGFSGQLTRFEDKELGIVCYRISGFEGVSCMKKPSKLETELNKSLDQ